jgi:transcription factor C subunit 3
MSTANAHSVPRRRGRPPKKKSEVVTFTSMKPGETASTSEPQGPLKKDSTKKRSTIVMDSDGPRRSKRRKDMRRDDLSPVRSTSSVGYQTVDPVPSAPFTDSHTRNKPSAGSADEESSAIHAHTQAQPGTGMPDTPNSGDISTFSKDSVLVPDASQQMSSNVCGSPSVYMIGHLHNLPI